jgi:dethiobiotin synthase
LIPGVFVTATGTNAGKTFVARGLARVLVRGGARVAALKPIETGCVHGVAVDALALARAARWPELASAPGLYRGRLAAAPYAATLAGESPVPSTRALVRAIADACAGATHAILEGAGGLLVPLDHSRTLADLIRALRLPALVVAPDALGVLSHVLALEQAARALDVPVAAVILSRHGDSDVSRNSNAQILRERLDVPVLTLGPCADDDDALAEAVLRAGIAALIP